MQLGFHIIFILILKDKEVGTLIIYWVSNDKEAIVHLIKSNLNNGSDT